MSLGCLDNQRPGLSLSLKHCRWSKNGWRENSVLSHTFYSGVIGATLYVMMVTCHYHFWKWWWVTTTFSRWNLQENRIFLLPEAFCGLKYAENAIVAGALPQTPLGELTTLPRPPSWLGSKHPPHTPPSWRLWRLDARALGASIVVPPWHQILATLLVTTTF